MDIITIKSDVHGLLLKSVRSRENDSVLMANIWAHQLKKLEINVDEVPARVLLEMLRDDNLVNWESATRCRRKLQQDHPALRGKNYKLRQEQQEEVKQQIRNFSDNQKSLPL